MAPNTVPRNVASAAEARPTKIDVSDPLIVFLRTSRPHLSPPKGSVALRSTGLASASTPLPARMSAITAASGSTDSELSVAGCVAPDGGVAGAPEIAEPGLDVAGAEGEVAVPEDV